MVNTSSAEPLKIVWICHFCNDFVLKKLPLSHKIKYQEFAPWIPETLKYFENDKRIQITIISPHKGLKKLFYSFQHNNIRYIFFKSDIPLIHKKISKFPLYLNRFLVHKHHYLVNILLIKYAVKRISPTILHLHGAENPYYSSAILELINKYPILITIQGFASHAINTLSKNLANRIEIEQRIIKQFTHFGIRTEKMSEDIKRINPHAKLLWHRYAINNVDMKKQRKIYDIVFFARICKEKGIEDLIKALGIICETRPKTSLVVIGSGSQDYIDKLKQLAKVNNVSDRIIWLGFLPTQKDVHKEASKAIISVLPTYHDIISGTIVESMKLGLPVVAYNTGSIPEVNRNEQRIVIVDKFDIQALADSILNLIENQELREDLSQKALSYANRNFGNENLKEELLNCYEEVISDFHKKGK